MKKRQNIKVNVCEPEKERDLKESNRQKDRERRMRDIQWSVRLKHSKRAIELI